MLFATRRCLAGIHLIFRKTVCRLAGHYASANPYSERQGPSDGSAVFLFTAMLDVLVEETIVISEGGRTIVLMGRRLVRRGTMSSFLFFFLMPTRSSGM